MANINEILARAAALRDETALNSISPERAGSIMYDTLMALNELWLQQGAALVISKIYASVDAMEADTDPVSDISGKPLRSGQIVVIASEDEDNGSVYRYNGPDSPSWSLVGKIGNLEPVDSLDSDSTQLPLAAHQGKVLDDKISQLGQQVIYDVSANNVGATFASLSALLSDENLSTLIPVAVRCGGMSIRFVQTSDNKYVQYRLMADEWSTIEANWQGVDDTPTAGSDNLVKSGGVKGDINGVNGAPVTISVESGSGHVATKDVVFINIPFGQKFYVTLPKNSLGINSIVVYAKYRENNSLINIGNVSKGQTQEFTASDNITSIGYYFEAPSASGSITIDIYTEKSFPFYEKKTTDVTTIDNSLFQGLLDVPNDISWQDGLALRSNGGTVEVSGYMTSSFMPVTPGKSYVYMGSKISSSYSSLAGYDSNQDFVQVLDSDRPVENNKPLIVTIPDNVNYVRIGLVKSVSIYGGIWILQDNIIQLLIDRVADPMSKSIYSVISLLNGILDVPNNISWQDGNVLKSDGTIVAVFGYMVSSFIPVTSGKSYVYMGAKVSSTFAALVGYNSSKEFVQVLDSERSVDNNDPMIVTIPNGISYVRIGLVKSISVYGGIWVLKNNIIQMLIDDSNSSKEELTTKTPEYIYCACDNVVNKSLALYADHLVYLGNNIQKKLIFKESNSDHVNIYAPITSSPTTVYNEGQTKLEKTINATIVGDYKDKPISFKMRSILNTATENTPIRVLCIGDSVTAGTGSLYPIELTNYAAQQYWKLMAELCFDDRINHNRPNGYKFLSIGKQVRSKFTRSNVEYTVFAEGRGGWAVSNYLFDETYLDIANYFYDGGKSWTGNYADELNAAGVKFSISSFLAKYKTLDDDGETRLVVGSTAGTEITDIYECDVCTPNIIVIQLSHNQNSTVFGQNIPLMIKAIKNEYPNIPIIISIIDETGCYNKELYPQFDNAALNWGTLHVNIFNDIDICKSLEQNFPGVYFCPSFAIQPTAWSVTTRNVKNAASLFRDFDFYAQIGNGANYHPSCFAHAAWAYQLLSCIKWILYNE